MPSDPPYGTKHQHSADDDIIASDRMAALPAEGQHQIFCSHSILCAASARREEIEITGWALSGLSLLKKRRSAIDVNSEVWTWCV